MIGATGELLGTVAHPEARLSSLALAGAAVVRASRIARGFTLNGWASDVVVVQVGRAKSAMTPLLREVSLSILLRLT